MRDGGDTGESAERRRERGEERSDSCCAVAVKKRWKQLTCSSSRPHRTTPIRQEVPRVAVVDRAQRRRGGIGTEEHPSIAYPARCPVCVWCRLQIDRGSSLHQAQAQSHPYLQPLTIPLCARRTRHAVRLSCRRKPHNVMHQGLLRSADALASPFNYAIDAVR